MKMKLNVLFIISSIQIGGAEVLVCEIARKLDKERFSPIICNLSNSKPIQNTIEKDKIEYVSLNKMHGRDLALPKKLVNVIKKYKIHIIHTHCQGPLLYTYFSQFFSSKSKPVFIHTEHCRLHDEMNYHKRHWLYNKLILKSIDGFISISNHVTEYNKKYFISEAEKIITIPNGVDIKELYKAKDISAPKEEFGIKDNAILIGNISALRREKDHATLIKAFKIVNREQLDTQLLIAGAGEARESLEQIIKENNLEQKVILLGYRRDVASLLNCFDIFVLPSLYEGFPICLIEAAAMGLPIVCTDIHGNREFISECQNGVLVPSENPEKMAEAIIKIIKNKDRMYEMGQKGKQHVEATYDFNNIILKYEQYYLKLYQKKKGHVQL